MPPGVHVKTKKHFVPKAPLLRNAESLLIAAFTEILAPGGDPPPADVLQPFLRHIARIAGALEIAEYYAGIRAFPQELSIENTKKIIDNFRRETRKVRNQIPRVPLSPKL